MPIYHWHVRSKVRGELVVLILTQIPARKRNITLRHKNTTLAKYGTTLAHQIFSCGVMLYDVTYRLRILASR